MDYALFHKEILAQSCIVNMKYALPHRRLDILDIELE